MAVAMQIRLSHEFQACPSKLNLCGRIWKLACIEQQSVSPHYSNSLKIGKLTHRINWKSIYFWKFFFIQIDIILHFSHWSKQYYNFNKLHNFLIIQLIVNTANSTEHFDKWRFVARNMGWRLELWDVQSSNLHFHWIWKKCAIYWSHNTAYLND